MQKITHNNLEQLSYIAGINSQLAIIDKNGISLSAHPRLSPALQHILHEVQRELGISGAQEREVEQLLQLVAQRLGFELSSYERDELLSYLENDQQVFGVLQKLVDDPSVSDIIVTDFNKICVQQGRRNYCTDLRFPNSELYEAFVERLLQRAGTTYSTKKPIADGMVGGLARIHAVHKSLCETGPYLTIRLNRFTTVTVEELVQVGFAPSEILKYLQGVVRGGQTVMVVGEVGTGKTTLVRALAATIPTDQSILVIEDTPEIRLQHPHVRYMTTREANSEGMGRVTPSECIRAGMRMAMNRIVFGEIRDAEAAEAFVDVCASGHSGVSTLHARSSIEAVTRLELFLARAQKAVQRAVLSEQICTALQVIVHVEICRETGLRRIMDVREIGPAADGVLRHRQIFSYSALGGLPRWQVTSKISNYRESLERDPKGIFLSRLPNFLELTAEQMLSEISKRRST